VARPSGSRIAVRLLADPERERVAPTGPLRSVQEAEISLDPARLEELWRPATLERFARGYWRYLRRVSLGLLRVLYGESSRAVVLLFRPLVLLRFHPPTYEASEDGGRVTWRIARGILVSRPGRERGYLRFDLRRQPDVDGEARVRVRAEVANFYPLLRGGGRFARIGSWVYAQTQLRIHVAVTRGFLRSLDRGELPALAPTR
jgi:hypothetical protein